MVNKRLRGEITIACPVSSSVDHGSWISDTTVTTQFREHSCDVFPIPTNPGPRVRNLSFTCPGCSHQFEIVCHQATFCERMAELDVENWLGKEIFWSKVRNVSGSIATALVFALWFGSIFGFLLNAFLPEWFGFFVISWVVVFVYSVRSALSDLFGEARLRLQMRGGTARREVSTKQAELYDHETLYNEIIRVGLMREAAHWLRDANTYDDDVPVRQIAY